MPSDHKFTYNTFTFDCLSCDVSWESHFNSEEATVYNLKCILSGQTLNGLRTAWLAMKVLVTQFNKDFEYKINNVEFDSFSVAANQGNIETRLSKPAEDIEGVAIYYNVQIKFQKQVGGGSQSRKTGTYTIRTTYDALGRKNVTYSRRTRFDYLLYQTADEQALDYVDNTFVMPSGFEFVSINDSMQENIWYGATPSVYWYWIEWSWTIREREMSDMMIDSLIKDFQYSYGRRPGAGNAANYIMITSIAGSFSISKEKRDVLQSLGTWSSMLSTYQKMLVKQVYKKLTPPNGLVTDYDFTWESERQCSFRIIVEQSAGYKAGEQYKECTLQYTARYHSGVIKTLLSDGTYHLQFTHPPKWTVSAIGSFRRYNKLVPLTTAKQVESMFSEVDATLTEYEESKEAPYYVSNNVIEYAAQLRLTWDVTSGKPDFTFINKLLQRTTFVTSAGHGKITRDPAAPFVGVIVEAPLKKAGGGR